MNNLMLTPKQEDEFNALMLEGKDDEAHEFYKKCSKENTKNYAEMVHTASE